MWRRINRIVVEWDVNKEKLNIQKHKLDFGTAAKVFFDSNRLEYYDAAHSVDEDRYITIGMINNIIAVVYAETHKRIRIISARKATAEEKEKYYGKNRKKGHKKKR